MGSFLQGNLAPDNCIQVWRQAAHTSELGQLKDKAAAYILTHFFHDDIKGQLQELTLPELLHILEDDDLPVGWCRHGGLVAKASAS